MRAHSRHVINDAGKVLKSKMTGTVMWVSACAYESELSSDVSRGHAAINVKEDALIIDDISQGVAVFKLSTTDRLKTFDIPFKTSRLRSVAFHDRNSAIITGSDHGKVYIFDRRTGDVIDTIDIGFRDWVQSIAIRSTKNTILHCFMLTVTVDCGEKQCTPRFHWSIRWKRRWQKWCPGLGKVSGTSEGAQDP